MSFVPLHSLTGATGQAGPAEHRLRPRLPSWFKVTMRQGPDYREIRRIMDTLNLHTICEEARCPNVWGVLE